MAIRVRRGSKADFDPNKLLSGEYASPLDSKEVFIAFGPGDIKRMATYEDMEQHIKDINTDIIAELADGIELDTESFLAEKDQEIDTATANFLATKSAEIDTAKNAKISEMETAKVNEIAVMEAAKNEKITEIDAEFNAKYQNLEVEYAPRLTTVESELADVANNTAVSLTHQFADNTARNAYFAAHPTENHENLFISVGTGFQQRISGAWVAKTAVVAQQVSAEMQPIADVGNYYISDDVNGALQEVGTELKETKINTASRFNVLEDTSRNIAKSIEAVAPSVNVSTYNPISTLGVNAREAVLSAKLKGRTLKNELVYNRDTWAEWTKVNSIGDSSGLEYTTVSGTATEARKNTLLKASTKYCLLLSVLSNTLTANSLVFDSYLTGGTVTVAGAGATGNIKVIFTTQSTISTNLLKLYISYSAASGQKIKLKDIRIFELPTGSQIETDLTNLTADELAIKYPYVHGQRDTKGGRLKTTGKNGFDATKVIFGYAVDSATGNLIAIANSQIVRLTVNSPLSYKISNYPSWGNRSYARYLDSSLAVLSHGAVVGLSLSPPTNCKYVEYYYYHGGSGAQPATNTMQLELGTTQTSYEPYTETLAYIPKIGKSLPNLTRDECNVATGEYVQNVKEYTLQSGDVANFTALVNVDVIAINKQTDSIVYNDAGTGVEKAQTILFPNFKATQNINADDVTKVGCIYNASTTRYGLIVAKGTYANLASAQTALAETKIQYQLATPITTLYLPQPLKSSPSGSIIWEPIIGEIGFYGNNLAVADTTLPIKSIVKLYKVNQADGSNTPLTISSTVISSDKLSFTHPSLVDGDLVDWDYEYDTQYSTNPLIEYGYDNGYSASTVLFPDGKSVEEVSGMSATNDITNGDFSAGTTGWSTQYITTPLVVVNNVCSYTATERYAGISKSIPNSTKYAGHKLYLSATFKTNSTDNYLLLNDGTNQAITKHSGSNLFETKSLIMTIAVAPTSLFIRIQDGRVSGWTETQCKYFILLDLTAIFGAGNEPTSSEMDLILLKFSNSWFDGTVNPLLTHKELFAYFNKNKANIKQEDWITPTLINGAIGSIKYRKNQFGKIEFKGELTITSTGQFMTLPTGYYTGVVTRIGLIDATNKIAHMQIGSTGFAYVYGNVGTFLLDGLGFN